MNWIKIKTKHLLFTDLTEAEVGTLIKVQLLTAHFERPLTRKEIEKQCNRKWLGTLEEKLSNTQVSIEYIMGKVLEDVGHIEGKRESGKSRVRKHRAKEKCNELPVTQCNEADKMILDKIKEDNIKTPSPLGDLTSIYKSNDFKLQQCQTTASIKAYVQKSNLTDDKKRSVMIALCNEINNHKGNKNVEFITGLHELVESYFDIVETTSLQERYEEWEKSNEVS